MIHFEHVSKIFDDQTVIDDLSLHIERGKITVIIGTSGSGKSTVLKMANRLLEHDRGRILFAGQEIRSFKPEDIRRRMGYVIQSTGLFPHWTVAQNIGTVPQLLHWRKEKIHARVDELLTMLSLNPDEYRSRFPHELSGGQQQRIGVARAMAADPEILLMDEPFGALDPITRAGLQAELKRIHRLFGKTILLITHDIDEALMLADHLVLLDGGRIVQQGDPLSIMMQPANDKVIEFIGRNDMGIKWLSLAHVKNHVKQGMATNDVQIAEHATLKEALSEFVVQGVNTMTVVDQMQRHIGVVHFNDLLHSMRGPETSEVKGDET
ncbi:Glycine betaine uptake system ATP-binding protein YehX [Ephemeroptericola cinctiostellae]|uniref:Glycine betaine uptake system ATP-binding protein YehX n=1 Tax=Ephemeroptericola cinctiostellae TaxID=2268024 RepID=A0A345DCI9_9BURK|nr:ABC transporter ATP-binding protein [Ephemeroptericola cinctiostellae]AXF86077.1 Glycine betaine uptake system ATP-binding protein YehX [Ephemeroptericola cinctiostellae]